MQNKIFLRSNSAALSVSGSYVGHVTTNFIFAAVPAVSPGGLINNYNFFVSFQHSNSNKMQIKMG